MKCFNCNEPATRLLRIKAGSVDDRWEAFVDLVSCDDHLADAQRELKRREGVPDAMLDAVSINGLQVLPCPQSDNQWRIAVDPKGYVERRRARRSTEPPADVLATLPQSVIDALQSMLLESTGDPK